VSERYFISHDNSGHAYLVPLARIAEWREWVELPDDDERSWDEPDFAWRMDGGLLSFTDPIINGKKVPPT
jgi:hypothetical protein